MTLVRVEDLRELAEVEFADVVLEAVVPGPNELRIMLHDGSFVDVWFSLKLDGRYSYHWERLAIDGTIYRHDNAPHRQWRSVRTFPHHFHNGDEHLVCQSTLDSDPRRALSQFLEFVRARLRELDKRSE